MSLLALLATVSTALAESGYSDDGCDNPGAFVCGAIVLFIIFVATVPRN